MIYHFIKEKKEEALKGRTIVYISNSTDISYVYLARILNDDIGCTLKTAKIVTKALNPDAEVSDFFICVERGN